MSVDKVKLNGSEIYFPHNVPRDNADIEPGRKKFTFPPINDINDISEELRHYFEEGINLKDSSASYRNNQINFNIQFHKRANEHLALKGNYFFQHQKLSANMKFTFQQQVEEDGVMKQKLFEFSYSLEAENIFERKKDVKEEKEDILNFIRRISHKVYELAEDDDLKLRSVYFDKEDMKDIIYFEDEKGRQVLMELVNLIILTARLKQSTNKGKEKFEVDYYPERLKTEKEETSTLQVNKFSAVLDIKELKNENNEEKNPEE